MRCSLGSELHQQYLFAEQAKFDIKSRRMPHGDVLSPSDKDLLNAKQCYVESFANWLSHQAFCHHCKPGAFAHKGEHLIPLGR